MVQSYGMFFAFEDGNADIMSFPAGRPALETISHEWLKRHPKVKKRIEELRSQGQFDYYLAFARNGDGSVDPEEYVFFNHAKEYGENYSSGRRVEVIGPIAER